MDMLLVVINNSSTNIAITKERYSIKANSRVGFIR